MRAARDDSNTARRLQRPHCRSSCGRGAQIGESAPQQNGRPQRLPRHGQPPGRPPDRPTEGSTPELYRINLHSCPVWDVAKQFGQTCDSELDFLRELLPEATVQRVTHKAAGAHTPASTRSAPDVAGRSCRSTTPADRRGVFPSPLRLREGRVVSVVMRHHCCVGDLHFRHSGDDSRPLVARHRHIHLVVGEGRERAVASAAERNRCLAR